MHPSGHSVTDLGVDSGAMQFQVCLHAAMLHVPHGGLRIEADCNTVEHWADCGLRLGRRRSQCRP
eukprot:1475989-Alexandrium_andersonii.AAC.1